jgi:hypothetical protein
MPSAKTSGNFHNRPVGDGLFVENDHGGFDRVRSGAVNHASASDQDVEFRYAL